MAARGFPHSSTGKESTCNEGDPGLIPGLGRSAGEGIGYRLQYSGLENSMDCIVHRVAKTRTWLSDWSDLIWLYPARLLCPWGFSRQEYWSGLPCPLPGGSSQPGIKPRSSTLLVESLLFEPPGKSKNTRVGNLSLLQGNFLTQESHCGLLHCRWILYQLSYHR